MKEQRRLVLGFWLMVLGMGLVWFGFFGLVELRPVEALSDDEVMRRATEMGWVPIKEVIQTEAEPETTTKAP